ncbi:MAG: ATP-binding protein [Elainella sp. Prado103]|jgi:signal transduction histidine kinase|nr:ATP-binding protein [Elainella sp. Prado103]
MKILHKIVLGHALAIGIAAIGTGVGLVIGYQRERQELQEREAAIHLYRFLTVLQADILYNRPAKQLGGYLQQPQDFDRESKALIQRVYAIRTAILQEINTETWSGGIPLKTTLTQYVTTLDRIVEKLNDFIAAVEQLSTPSTDPTQVNDPAQAQMLLIELVNSPEFKAFIEFPDQLVADQQQAEQREKAAIANLKHVTTLQAQITIISLILSIVIAMGLALYTSHLIASPLQAVTHIASRVTQESNLNLQAPLLTQDEVGTLALTLNQLINQARYLLDQQTASLLREQQRATELSQALTDLQVAQQDLIQAEKMAVLGQLTASVAHELNTPLGVIRGATSNIMMSLQVVLQQLSDFLSHLSDQQRADFLAVVNTAIQKPSLPTQAERQLRRQWRIRLEAQGIDQVDFLATQLTLLRLEADTPLNLSFLLQPNAPALLEMAYHLVLQQQNATSIQQEVDRAAKIVFALKSYSDQGHIGEKSLVQITDSIEVALTLYQNRLKQGIQVRQHYAPAIPPILGDPDEMIQIWVNLIDNAIDAMGQTGTLDLAVFEDNDQIVVEVTDSGVGIPAAVATRIFEPFFTTKQRGEGSGLGLDIVQKIVRKHGGGIAASSQPGQTTFRLWFPRQADME